MSRAYQIIGVRLTLLGNGPPVNLQNLTGRTGQPNPSLNGFYRAVRRPKNRSYNRLASGSRELRDLIAFLSVRDDAKSLAVVSNEMHLNIDFGIWTSMACEVVGYRR